MKKNINIFGYNIYIELKKSVKATVSTNINLTEIPKPYKLNFGPGPNWTKPDMSWLSVDIDASLGEIVVNFQEFEKLPFSGNST